MSVIVWDGSTLAADSQINGSGVSHDFNKIVEIPANVASGKPRTLAGAVGPMEVVGPILHWVIEGQQGNIPGMWGGGQLILITKEKGLVRYSPHSAKPLLHGFNKIAIGEGAPFAYGAMSALDYLGATEDYDPAYIAVKAAIEHSPHCNGEPITLKL